MEMAGSREKSLQVNSHNRYKNRHLRLILNSKGGLEEEGKKKKKTFWKKFLPDKCREKATGNSTFLRYLKCIGKERQLVVTKNPTDGPYHCNVAENQLRNKPGLQ